MDTQEFFNPAKQVACKSCNVQRPGTVTAAATWMLLCPHRVQPASQLRSAGLECRHAHSGQALLWPAPERVNSTKPGGQGRVRRVRPTEGFWVSHRRPPIGIRRSAEAPAPCWQPSPQGKLSLGVRSWCARSRPRQTASSLHLFAHISGSFSPILHYSPHICKQTLSCSTDRSQCPHTAASHPPPTVST